MRFLEVHHTRMVSCTFLKNAQLVLRFQNTQLMLCFPKSTASAVFFKNAPLALRFPKPYYMLTSIYVSQRHSPKLYVIQYLIVFLMSC